MKDLFPFRPELAETLKGHVSRNLVSDRIAELRLEVSHRRHLSFKVE